ncbi:uncharacterized protein LOC132654629 [Meriones unguiculatus]|uniref:uncharacterized protein LOC132654629 n=1 Tax=Meriones unguiculatus TaxID=10047 RepID=UPI00293F704F|nr:uncharacterized protein LOC132654629 [Meriones unguiculatus]
MAIVLPALIREPAVAANHSSRLQGLAAERRTAVGGRRPTAGLPALCPLCRGSLWDRFQPAARGPRASGGWEPRACALRFRTLGSPPRLGDVPQGKPGLASASPTYCQPSRPGDPKHSRSSQRAGSRGAGGGPGPRPEPRPPTGPSHSPGPVSAELTALAQPFPARRVETRLLIGCLQPDYPVSLRARLVSAGSSSRLWAFGRRLSILARSAGSCPRLASGLSFLTPSCFLEAVIREAVSRGAAGGAFSPEGMLVLKLQGVSLCSLGCPGARSVEQQASFTEICLPNARIKGVCRHRLAIHIYRLEDDN